EVMSRLDEITDRLTAIENLLAEIRNPAGTARKASSGEPELPGGAQREPPAGGGEPPGQPEPPAAEAWGGHPRRGSHEGRGWRAAGISPPVAGVLSALAVAATLDVGVG